MFRTSGVDALISTIPPALSAIGPKTSMDRTYAAVLNIPIVATAVPNNPPTGSPFESYNPEACRKVMNSFYLLPEIIFVDTCPIRYDIKTAKVIVTAGNIVDCSPTDIPAITLVPAPVVDDFAI